MNYFACMKRFTLVGSSILVLVMLIAAAAFINKNNEVPEKHAEIVLRNVGHQLLLAAKDSTSRVLPVKKLKENTYQLSFQNDFSFISDTLINLVQRELKKTALATNYIVSLKNCEQKETVFAFEINGQAGDLTPCKGRKLETGCYVIEIDLLPKNKPGFLWLTLLIIPLGLAGFYAAKKFRKKEEKEPVFENNDHIQLGSFQFYPNTHVLKIENNSIELSEKETKALQLFAENINQVVEREKLMKEIWEDKGVVVISRNVDVLVSKLRKKLSDDNSIKFINVHGRGYKFIIE